MKLLSRYAPGIIAVTIASGASVALATFASAQNAPPAPPAAASTAPMPPRGPMERGGPGPHGGPMMRELERFKASLRLSASQTALWDRAEATMQPPTNGREAMRARHDRMAAMLDDPAFDPRKLAADMDAAYAERRVKMAGMRDAWFAVYDSLNPVQRGQAREFLRSHFGRSHGMGRGLHDRMGGERHEHGDGGRPPMPPPPAPAR